MSRSSFTVLITSFLVVTGCADPQSEATVQVPDAPSGDVVAQMSAAPKFNLNSATAEDFLTIPGMTDRMVHEFEEYRPYVSIRQFRQEIAKYVSDDVVAGYEEFVFVPVDPNNSDAETLMQIPGVDASVVEEILAARPFDSPESFLQALAPMVSMEQASDAAHFLMQQ